MSSGTRANSIFCSAVFLFRAGLGKDFKSGFAISTAFGRCWSFLAGVCVALPEMSEEAAAPKAQGFEGVCFDDKLRLYYCEPSRSWRGTMQVLDTTMDATGPDDVPLFHQSPSSRQFAARLFPYQPMYRWLAYGGQGPTAGDNFSRREFSFTLANDIYIRCEIPRSGIRPALLGKTSFAPIVECSDARPDRIPGT